MKKERQGNKRERDGAWIGRVEGWGVVNFLQFSSGGSYFLGIRWLDQCSLPAYLLVHGDINCCSVHHQAEKPKTVFSHGSTLSPLVHLKWGAGAQEFSSEALWLSPLNSTRKEISSLNPGSYVIIVARGYRPLCPSSHSQPTVPPLLMQSPLWSELQNLEPK